MRYNKKSNVFSTDDIPVRGFIGHLEEGGFLPHSHKISIWTHLHFNIEYNGDQVSYTIFFLYWCFPLHRICLYWCLPLLCIWIICSISPRPLCFLLNLFYFKLHLFDSKESDWAGWNLVFLFLSYFFLCSTVVLESLAVAVVFSWFFLFFSRTEVVFCLLRGAAA